MHLQILTVFYIYFSVVEIEIALLVKIAQAGFHLPFNCSED